MANRTDFDVKMLTSLSCFSRIRAIVYYRGKPVLELTCKAEAEHLITLLHRAMDDLEEVAVE